MFLDKRNIELIENKNDETMEEMFNMYSNLVYLYILKMVKDKMLAEELLLDTFIYAFKNVSKFNGSCKETTWLCGIARNYSLHALRNQTKERKIIIYDENVVYDAIDISQERSEIEVFWDDFIKSSILSNHDLDICMLFLYYGLKQKVISEIMECTLNMVKKSIRKGKNKMLEFYEKRKKDNT